MSTKDNNSGLLSKVAKFVRNPTTNWTDLDKQEPEPEAGYSKQALKEMIERKRQNDFVRKREFDQLRKLRSRDPSAGNADLAGRPSYFQSSLPSNPDERAMTIKKIDEIEAQMSNQWWHGKGDAAKVGTGATAKPPTPAEPDPAKPVAHNSYAATKAAPMYEATKLASMMPEAAGADSADFMPTQTNSSFGRIAAAAPPAAQRSARSAPATPRAGDGAGSSYPQSFAAGPAEVITDADLEEAAIRFANGDNAGAESGLLNALQGGEVHREQAEVWTSALFDLYRATGQQARFDKVAIEYAERFGRSAPAWFSMPDLLGVKSSASVARTVPSRLVAEPIWTSPANFEWASVDDLQLAVANANPPWFLDWTPLVAVQPDAMEPLGLLIAQWCFTTVQLRFQGSEILERVLRSCTPSGDRNVNQAQWRLRMDALRIMGLQDEFELVALDYCVTYEVSPPAWQDARCTFHREPSGTPESEDADGDPIEAGDSGIRREPDDGLAPTLPMGLDSAPAAVIELSGEVVGEATEALQRLESARQGGERLVISCANLVRVDFSAAGGILNWVAQRQAEGCNVQFRDVHRLVAAFFHLIGINEHARVVLRAT